jgi:uncharacterized protein YbjT (DUF2867 family)
MILVVGATAPFGRQTVEALVAAGQDVRALTREPADANLPAEAEVVYGDLAKPETLPAALAGVSAMFLVLPYGLDPAPLLQAAAPGVRIVLLSSGAIVDSADPQPDVIAAYHAGVERAIVESGADWTFLRILFPAINALPLATQVKNSGGVSVPYADAQAAPVHEADVAEAATRVLTEPGYSSRVYNLTGQRSLTQRDQIRAISRAIGRALTVADVDPAPVLRQLSQFMDPDFAAALFALMAATVGQPARVTKAVEELTGHPARDFTQWAIDHKADFS